MNRKERRAEAKQKHKNINNQQEETMSNNETSNLTATETNNTQPEEIKRMENMNQPGFFTRIKNAFVAGYRAGKSEIKEQALEIQDTYMSVLEENGNVIIKHTKACVKTAFHIIKKTLKNLFAVIAWPFIKIDSIIDPKEIVSQS